MLRPITLRTLAILVCLPLSAQAAPAGAELAVIAAEFGVFEDDGGDQLGFGATSAIPLSPGQSYGWLVELRTTRKSVAVREELAAARDAAEEDVEAGPDVSPAKDARSLDPTRQATSGPLLASAERRLPVMDGIVFAPRKVSAGDKPGRFRLRVYIEKQLAAVFSYEIVAAKGGATQSVPSVAAPRVRQAKDRAPKKKP